VPKVPTTTLDLSMFLIQVLVTPISIPLLMSQCSCLEDLIIVESGEGWRSGWVWRSDRQLAGPRGAAVGGGSCGFAGPCCNVVGISSLGTVILVSKPAKRRKLLTYRDTSTIDATRPCVRRGSHDYQSNGRVFWPGMYSRLQAPYLWGFLQQALYDRQNRSGLPSL
jgi:hypothetical protein